MGALDGAAGGAALGTAISPGLGTVIGGALGALSAIFGTSKSAESNRETNEMNYKIAQEQNALNKWMLQSQQQFSLDQWNRENEYNLPKNVAQRLLEAGYNPAIVGGNASTPAGAIGQPSAQAAVGASMRPFDYVPGMTSLGSQISNSFDAYFRNRNIESVTRKNQADTSRTEGMTPYEIKHLQALATKEGVAGQLAKTELAYQQAIQGQKISQVFNDVRLQKKSLDMMDREMLGRELQNQLFQVQLAYAPKLNEAQLNQYYATVNELKAQVGLINANALLTKEQRLTEIERRTGVIVDNNLKDFDLDLKKALKNVTINTAKEDLYLKEDNRFFRGLDKYKEHIGRAGNFVITPGSASLVSDWQQFNEGRNRFNHSQRYNKSPFRPH